MVPSVSTGTSNPCWPILRFCMVLILLQALLDGAAVDSAFGLNYRNCSLAPVIGLARETATELRTDSVGKWLGGLPSHSRSRLNGVIGYNIS